MILQKIDNFIMRYKYIVYIIFIALIIYYDRFDLQLSLNVFFSIIILTILFIIFIFIPH